MKRSNFLLITALLSFTFGALMFFVPGLAAEILAMGGDKETIAALHGMGGLIIGSGVINFLLRNQTNVDAIRSLLLANIITHLLGITADIWAVFDGALSATNIIPVEITHLFVGIGSLIYLSGLNKLSAAPTGK
jgi:hypothetical protein